MKTIAISITLRDEQAAALKWLVDNAQAATVPDVVRHALKLYYEGVAGKLWPPTPERRGAPPGSRLPEARDLGLSTVEYRRRLRCLAQAGITAPSREQILGVKPAPRRR
jgi:hypothetical protein